jgi:hypothetical protein
LSNTATVITISGTWTTNPDNTSVFALFFGGIPNGAMGFTVNATNVVTLNPQNASQTAKYYILKEDAAF